MGPGSGHEHVGAGLVLLCAFVLSVFVGHRIAAWLDSPDIELVCLLVLADQLSAYECAGYRAPHYVEPLQGIWRVLVVWRVADDLERLDRVFEPDGCFVARIRGCRDAQLRAASSDRDMRDICSCVVSGFMFWDLERGPSRGFVHFSILGLF